MIYRWRKKTTKISSVLRRFNGIDVRSSRTSPFRAEIFSYLTLMPHLSCGCHVGWKVATSTPMCWLDYRRPHNSLLWYCVLKFWNYLAHQLQIFTSRLFSRKKAICLLVLKGVSCFIDYFWMAYSKNSIAWQMCFKPCIFCPPLLKCYL